MPLFLLLHRRILFFFFDNDLFPPLLCMLLGAPPSAPLLARRVWLSGSSFCRFASLVFILRRYRAIFIPRYSSSSFLPLLHHHHHLLLRPSSPVLEDYLRARIIIIRNLSPRNPEREIHSLIEKFKELNSASLVFTPATCRHCSM